MVRPAVKGKEKFPSEQLQRNLDEKSFLLDPSTSTFNEDQQRSIDQVRTTKIMISLICSNDLVERHFENIDSNSLQRN